MTLIFDQYVASQGKGISVTESRKNCQLNIALLYPSGFQYSVFSADYRGYAALDKGVNGTQKSTYYFSGQTAQVSEFALSCLRIGRVLISVIGIDRDSVRRTHEPGLHHP